MEANLPNLNVTFVLRHQKKNQSSKKPASTIIRNSAAGLSIREDFIFPKFKGSQKRSDCDFGGKEKTLCTCHHTFLPHLSQIMFTPHEDRHEWTFFTKKINLLLSQANRLFNVFFCCSRWTTGNKRVLSSAQVSQLVSFKVFLWQFILPGDNWRLLILKPEADEEKKGLRNSFGGAWEIQGYSLIYRNPLAHCVSVINDCKKWLKSQDTLYREHRKPLSCMYFAQTLLQFSC